MKIELNSSQRNDFIVAYNYICSSDRELWVLAGSILKPYIKMFKKTIMRRAYGYVSEPQKREFYSVCEYVYFDSIVKDLQRGFLPRNGRYILKAIVNNRNIFYKG